MKKFLSVLMAAMMLCIVFAGCAAPAAPAPAAEAPAAAPAAEAPAAEAPAEEAPKADGDVGELAMVAMAMGMPYFESVRVGAEAYAKEKGYTFTFTGPASVDAAAQANIIQDLITKGVSAIAVSPIDSSSLAPVLKQAAEAGIRVITFDLDLDSEEGREFYVSPLDNLAMARHMADVMAELVGKEGEIAILEGTVTSTIENARVEEMQRHVAETYPNITIVTVEAGEDDMQKSIEVATNMLTAYPNLKGIICNSSVAVPGAGRAVMTAGKAGQVKICGLTTPNEVNELVHQDAVQAVQLWDTGEMGALAVEAMAQLVKGTTIDDNYKFEAFPKAYVTGTVIMQNHELDMTAENIDNYDF